MGELVDVFCDRLFSPTSDGASCARAEEVALSLASALGMARTELEFSAQLPSEVGIVEHT